MGQPVNAYMEEEMGEEAGDQTPVSLLEELYINHSTACWSMPYIALTTKKQQSRMTSLDPKN